MAFLDDSHKSQQQRFLGWEGAISRELLLVALEGSESLSSPFQYILRSLTRKKECDLARWHGASVSCHIGDGSFSQPRRFLHGRVTLIRYVQRTAKEAECILTLEPSLALLKKGRMMRIWQNINVPDVVQTLLSNCGINDLDIQLRGQYPNREYCIQYRESPFDFIQRLLNEEGIYYYFKHSASGHTLVLTDHQSTHPSIQGNSLPWSGHDSGLNTGNIDSWSTTSSLLPAGVILHGVNMPQALPIEYSQSASDQSPHINGVTFTDISLKGERSMLTHEAQNTMAAHEANIRIFDATVNAHWLCSGETFSLDGHPSGEKSYRIQSLSLKVINNLDGSNSDCQCELQAMNHAHTWRPPTLQYGPMIPGVLTATVVGPSSEEIHTDEYGRIKIQFPWDKENPHDDTSSCWVRVAQVWTGNKFGAQFIPRIGSEVLVSFIHGHSDFPLVTGTVFNGQNKPPFALPAEKNESGFITRSSTKGCVEDGHRLSFNDKKGEELLTIVAQKDMSLTVKNNINETIAANRNTELTKGDDRLQLKEGDMSVTLDKGNWHKKVKGNATTELNNGDYTLKVTAGGGKITTDNALIFQSSQSIELKVGTNTLTLSTSGISINGKTVKIEGITSTEVTAKTLKLEGSISAELKGTTTKVSGTALTTIDGTLIKIG